MRRGTLAFVAISLLLLLLGSQPALAGRQPLRPPRDFAFRSHIAQARSALSDQEGSGLGWCGQFGGHGLGAVFDGVYACGPSVGEADPFDSVGFQCVELSARFLWVVYGRYVTNIPSGKDFVWDAHEQLHLPVGVPAVGSVPVPGDIMSIAGGDTDGAFGHTGVVASVDVNPGGNGRIRMMEQNASASGWGTIYVHRWVESYGQVGYGAQNTISWLETGSPPVTLPLGIHVKFEVQPVGKRTTVTGVNKDGEVTGLQTFRTGPDILVERPFVYSSGHRKVLAAPGNVGALTETSTINDLSQVGVSAEVGHLPSVAFVIAPTGKRRWYRLPNPLSGPGASAALGINDKGEIAGWLTRRNARMHSLGVVWIPKPHKGPFKFKYKTRLYRPAPTFDDVRVYASDRLGDAVGTETSSTGDFYPTVWLGGGARYRLPATIGGPSQPGSASVLSMSDQGESRTITVIGSSNGDDSSIESTEWRIRVTGNHIKVLKIRHLGMVSQAQESVADGVNSHNWVVGDSIAPRKQHSAQLGFLVRPKVGMIPLGLMVGDKHWVISGAASVNAKGQVAAEGYELKDGKHGPKQAILLTPVQRTKQ